MNNPTAHNFRDLKIADTHIHIVYPESVDSTEKILREVVQYFNFSRIGLMCLTSSSCHRAYDCTNNVKALYLKEKINRDHPDSVFVYANPLHHFDERDTSDHYFQQIKLFHAMGADGLKLLDGKPYVRKRLKRTLCDPVYDKMYAYAEENGIPVKMHVADPLEFWGPKEEQSVYALKYGWWCGDGSFPSFQALHDEVYEILKKFPKLKFCAAHCSYLSHDIEALTDFFEKWENTSIDLTPGPINLVEISKKPDEWRTFFKKYASRIFFGTDIYNKVIPGEALSKYEAWSATTSVRTLLEKTRECVFTLSEGNVTPINLDDDVLSEIYFGSFIKLHPHARPVQVDALLEECSALLQNLKSRALPLSADTEYPLEEANLTQIIDYFSQSSLR